MAVPKKRSSRSVRDMRRAHDFLTASAASEPCPACGELKRRHQLCAACGAYRGKQVFGSGEPAPGDLGASVDLGSVDLGS